MKRDPELVREILFALEDHDRSKMKGPPEVEGKDPRLVKYHMEILVQAGLVQSEFRTLESTMIRDRRGSDELIQHKKVAQGRDTYRLTWQGHEFLDAARSKSIWQEAMKKFTDSGVGIAFDVLKAVLTHEAKSALGLRD